VDTTADVYGLGRLGLRLLEAERVPDGVAAVLRRATARDPRDRHPDASAFAAALDQALHRGPHGFLRTVGVVAAVLLLAAVPSDVARPAGVRTATDGTGQLTVVLPTGWRAAGAGWAGRYGVDGGLEPAFVISPDPARWRTDPAVPGAFVGLSRTAAARTTAAGFVAEQPHARCSAAPVRRTRQAGLDWVVARFTCTTPKPVIVEAAGVDAGALVYVQLAARPGATDAEVDALLSGITVE
jgi:hypothetical protein